MQLFGGEQGKAFGQIKTHLITKHRARAGAGAVGFIGAVGEYMAH